MRIRVFVLAMVASVILGAALAEASITSDRLMDDVRSSTATTYAKPKPKCPPHHVAACEAALASVKAAIAVTIVHLLVDFVSNDQ